jgi:uncharacterized RDD family membrane protein YckC
VIEPGANEEPPGALKPAGVLRRLPATLIDMAVYCGICALLAYPAVRAIDWQPVIEDPTTVIEVVSDPSWIAHAAGIIGLWIALWWCYFAMGWGLIGTTVGKWIFGLVIVDHRGRSPIGLSRAFLRLAAYSVSSVTIGMGHLLIVLRDDKRALHDVLAGTWVVVRTKTAARNEETHDDAPSAEDD